MWMGSQSLRRVELPRQLRLGQGCMDFLMADVMHQHRRTTLATLQLGNQVMHALFHAWRDWAQTQWADRIGFGQ